MQCLHSSDRSLVICHVALTKTSADCVVCQENFRGLMASASSSSARILFGDSKSRINQRVQYTVQGLGSLAKNVVRTSKSTEILTHSAKSFAQQEGIIETSELVRSCLKCGALLKVKLMRSLIFRHCGRCKFF